MASKINYSTHFSIVGLFFPVSPGSRTVGILYLCVTTKQVLFMPASLATCLSLATCSPSGTASYSLYKKKERERRGRGGEGREGEGREGRKREREEEKERGGGERKSKKEEIKGRERKSMNNITGLFSYLFCVR